MKNEDFLFNPKIDLPFIFDILHGEDWEMYTSTKNYKMECILYNIEHENYLKILDKVEKLGSCIYDIEIKQRTR